MAWRRYPQWAGQRFKSAKVLVAYKGDVPLLVAVVEGRIEQLTETGVIDTNFDNLKLTSRTSQPASYYDVEQSNKSARSTANDASQRYRHPHFFPLNRS